MFFPSPSTWNMGKDSPNHVMMKMIGLSQTPQEILEDGDVSKISSGSKYYRFPTV